MIHAIDWLPTLASVAGIQLPIKLKLDGIDVWKKLSNRHEPTPRRLLHSLDDIYGYSSYMRHNLKYVNGSAFNGKYDSWLSDGVSESEEEDPLTAYYVQDVLSSAVHDTLGYKGLSISDIESMRMAATHRCPPSELDSNNELYRCEPLKAACYFDIVNDPCERFNLAKTNPYQLKQLAKEVNYYRATAVPPALVRYSDPLCNPAFYEGNWQWWESDRGRGTAGQSSYANFKNLILSGFSLIVASIIT